MEIDKMEFQTVKGMRDLLPMEFELFKKVIMTVQTLFKLYNYQEVSMPILEPFELLAAKSGEEIKDTMYVFEDKGGRLLALRPEMTASVARVYITHFMKAIKKPLRLSYIGACYRYDNPQYGRYREFRQAGFELIGAKYPEADAEILKICDDLMTRLGFKEFHFKVGHVGILREILEQEGLGEDVQNKVFSLIDREKIEEAYQIFTTYNLSKGCREIISRIMELKGKNIKELIDEATDLLKPYPKAQQAIQNIKEILTLYLSFGDKRHLFCDFGFARGLEYYTGMIFEIYVPKISIAVGGGGRYDKLIETFHGQPTPAVGCAPGIDRIVLAMKELGIKKYNEQFYVNIVIITCIDEIILPEAFKIAETLRKNDIPVEFDVARKNLKKFLSYASEKKMRFAIIIGPDEIVNEKVVVRDLSAQKQETIATKELVSYFKDKI
ncbi:MAG: histidine--tRNA ligase [Candidatus Helarchaeota archaeon]